MSTHPTVLAATAYKRAHPEIDFTGQMIRLARDADGQVVAVGHEPTPDYVKAALASCCCHPGQPRHHG